MTSCWFDMMKWLKKHKSQAKGIISAATGVPYIAILYKLRPAFQSS